MHALKNYNIVLGLEFCLEVLLKSFITENGNIVASIYLIVCDATFKVLNKLLCDLREVLLGSLNLNR